MAFSCKGRGFCPTCMGRRMRVGSEHLVESVLPCVPVRQWVLTLPHALRYRLAWDHALCLEVHRAFAGALRQHYESIGRGQGLTDPSAGSVTVVQRFGSALELNVHFHTLVPDGCFFADAGGNVGFRAAPTPSPADIAAVLEGVGEGVWTAAEKHGYALDGLVLDRRRAPVVEDAEPGLAQLQLAALVGARGVGEAAAQPARRLRTRPPRPPTTTSNGFRKLKARRDGFDLHAGVCVGAFDRERLETLCRYLLRPPLSEARLQKVDTRYLLRLKTPWRDGTTHVVFEAEELVARLVALIPRPQANQILYSGVLAPRAKLRDRATALHRGAPAERRRQKRLAARRGRNQRGCPGNPTFAELMRKSFATDLHRCPKCEGRLELVELIEGPTKAKPDLERLGMLAVLERIAPSRAPRAPPKGDEPREVEVELDDEALEERLLELLDADRDAARPPRADPGGGATETERIDHDFDFGP